MIMNKICNKCEKEKSEEEYDWRKTPAGKTIRNSICSQCISEYQKERYKDPEVRIKQALSTLKYGQSDVGRKKEKNARYLREYGITLEDKERMIQENGSICPICKTSDPGRFWTVDHCHRTGKIRGILCDKCNKMLGLANDDMVRLISAAHYLSTHYLNREPADGVPGIPMPDEELEYEREEDGE